MLILGFILGVASTVVVKNFLKDYKVTKKNGSDE